MTDTAKTTTFIDEFKTWRDAKITAPTDTSTLTAEAFLKLSTYVDKVDIVKEKADAWFVELVNYHQSDLALKAMGITKPTPSADLLALATDDKVKEFYTKYGKLWLLKALQSSSETTLYKYKINIEQVNDDLNSITGNTMFTKQTMMINFLAVKEKAPQFLPFISYSANLIEKVKDQLLLQDSIDKYLKEAVTDQVKNKDVANEYDQYRFNELKTKLDLLDPTFALSNKVLSVYNCALYAFITSAKPNDTPIVRKIYTQNILRQLKKIYRNEDNEFHTLVGEMKASYGGALTKLAHKLSSAFFTHMNSNLSNTINPEHVVTLETVLLMKESSANALKLPANESFYKFGNALLVSCQLASIAYGFLNYNKLNKFQKGLLYTGTALTVVDIARAIAGKTVFNYMANVISDVLFYRGGTALAKGLSKALVVVPQFVGRTIVQICNKLVPIFLIISIGFSIWDAVIAAKEQNWGIFAVSVAEIVATLGSGICIIFATTAWAGPVSLILGGVLIALALIKVIWGFLTALIEGDPRLNFIESVEFQYKNSPFIDFYYQYVQTNGPIDTDEQKQKFLTVYKWVDGTR
ncbi:hypothetical protein DLAC_00004 [Tieghemostelium lacteum]|uniref:Uncharacterized protein n=1 Tax=Tieghemostelium lacteum TaxID=361077 RepID=A0A152A8V8_TIELA|nr:hypothetical protein DLAC_00004 [Tieghemostelium lacteum]|eukprot:KYR02565.1 hypothetical protein DLAC_00004 [Tieghemostelium lacteum]